MKDEWSLEIAAYVNASYVFSFCIGFVEGESVMSIIG